MNQPNKVVGTYQRSFLPGISDPKKSQQPPPPSGGQDELRGESPGIPCCRSRVPDLSQLISELELIQLLSRGGSPTPRAQRAVCRRWIDRHAISTLRLGNSRFHPRQQVLAPAEGGQPAGGRGGGFGRVPDVAGIGVPALGRGVWRRTEGATAGFGEVDGVALIRPGPVRRTPVNDTFPLAK